jgi:hypothetical protein
MRSLTIALAITTALLTTYGVYQMTGSKNLTSSSDQEWVQWKQNNNKSYGTDSLEKHHYNNFVWNRNYIANNQVAGLTLGLNKFADLSFAEFKAQYMGATEAPKYLNRFKNYVSLSTIKSGSSVDWRTQNKVTPVRDQGQCGSCWAFSAIASAESSYLFQKSSAQPTDVNFSEQQLVDCAGGVYGNLGCNGGLMDHAFDYISDNGVRTSESYPYTARDGTCKAASATPVDDFVYNGYTDVPAGDCDQLSAALQTTPVSVAVAASSNWQLYVGGVLPASCSTQLDHGVFLVAESADTWTIKNSWGASWGENGFIRLPKTNGSCGANSCGLCNSASYLKHPNA